MTIDANKCGQPTTIHIDRCAEKQCNLTVDTIHEDWSDHKIQIQGQIV